MYDVKTEKYFHLHESGRRRHSTSLTPVADSRVIGLGNFSSRLCRLFPRVNTVAPPPFKISGADTD